MSEPDTQLDITAELETWDEWFNRIPAFGGHHWPSTQPALTLATAAATTPTDDEEF